MKEVKTENELNLKVFINGVPDISLMPRETFEAFVSALELQISGYCKDKNEKEVNSRKE